jgi:hypothetical protein
MKASVDILHAVYAHTEILNNPFSCNRETAVHACSTHVEDEKYMDFIGKIPGGETLWIYSLG